MTKLRIPIPALILALVLGPDLETALRRSFLLSKGSPLIFLQRPIALVLVLPPCCLCLPRPGRAHPALAGGQDRGLIVGRTGV